MTEKEKCCANKTQQIQTFGHLKYLNIIELLNIKASVCICAQIVQERFSELTSPFLVIFAQ